MKNYTIEITENIGKMSKEGGTVDWWYTDLRRETKIENGERKSVITLTGSMGREMLWELHKIMEKWTAEEKKDDDLYKEGKLPPNRWNLYDMLFNR